MGRPRETNIWEGVENERGVWGMVMDDGDSSETGSVTEGKHIMYALDLMDTQ